MFDKLSQEMLERFLEKNPDFATYLGLHDPYDYLMPKGSTERLVENLRLMEEWLHRLNETIRREELSEDRRTDWNVIEKAYELWKFQLYELRMHELNPDATEELGGLIFIMFTRNYASLEKRLDAIAARIEKMPKFLEEFRTRFQNSRPVKLWTELAIEKAQNLGGLFQFILYVAKGKVSEKVYERLSRAIQNLQPELKKHMEWLQSLLPRRF